MLVTLTLVFVLLAVCVASWAVVWWEYREVRRQRVEDEIVREALDRDRVSEAE